jgi:hypothetical protein
MAKITDVIGFAADADIYCPDCASATYGDTDTAQDREGNELGAVFGDSETDCPYHCAECGVLIPERLTTDGVNYVADALAEYIASVLFTNADGTAKHGGRLSVLEDWRAEYGDVVSGVDACEDGTTDAKRATYGERLLTAFDAVSMRQRLRPSVVLVKYDKGYGRSSGEDAEGNAWTDTDGNEDGTPEDCAECGAAVYAGWLCMDGGDVICSAHVFTPEDARSVAADWHDGQSSALYALASSGTVTSLASYYAKLELGALDVLLRPPSARPGYPLGRTVLARDERWRERAKLRALVAYCDGMRSHVYPESLLSVRGIVISEGWTDNAKLLMIARTLTDAGLTMPDTP